MKLKYKIINSMILITFLITIFSSLQTTYAVKGDYEWTGYAQEKTSIEAKKTTGGAAGAIQNVLGTIIQVVRVVGTGVAIIMLTYVGIKYMTAAPSEKAEFKKSATAFVVGAVIVFAASNIAVIIAKFAAKNI